MAMAYPGPSTAVPDFIHWNQAVHCSSLVGMPFLCQGTPSLREPNSYTPLEPREGEPRQPNKAYQGLLVAIVPFWVLLGCLGSNGLYDQYGLITEDTFNYVGKVYCVSDVGLSGIQLASTAHMYHPSIPPTYPHSLCKAPAVPTFKVPQSLGPAGPKGSGLHPLDCSPGLFLCGGSLGGIQGLEGPIISMCAWLG